MAKITRYTGNLPAFAINADTTKRRVFGNISLDSDTLDDNINADYQTGWEIIGTSEFPSKQDFNGLGFTLGQQHAYMHQMGVPEWDGAQEYHAGSIANVAGVLYVCKIDTHVSATSPPLDSVNWEKQSSTFVPREYIAGLELAVSVVDAENDITIVPGSCSDSLGEAVLELASATTKQLDAAYSYGNNAGGLFSGTAAADTWYHVFVIERDSDGAVDIGFDVDPGAANIPAGFTRYNWIGAILTDGSTNIVPFTQVGSDFIWKSPRGSFNTADPGTTAVLAEADVPTGLSVKANLSINILLVSTSTLTPILLATSPLSDDTLPTSSIMTVRAAGQDSVDAGDISTDSSYIEIITDSSAQIRYRLTESDSTIRVRCTTYGWVAPRAGSFGAAGSTGSPISSVTQLSDYEEGTWTPTLSFVTPGDLSITYDNQTGYYTKVGRLISLNLYVRTTAFTHTTGSGAVVIEGIPFNAVTGTRHVGALCWGGITFVAPYTTAILNMNDGGTRLTIDKSGQSTDLTNVEHTETPSGTNQNYRGSIVYHEV